MDKISSLEQDLMKSRALSSRMATVLDRYEELLKELGTPQCNECKEYFHQEDMIEGEYHNYCKSCAAIVLQELMEDSK